MKGHELPLRAQLHQPRSPPSSATAAGEAGAHADAALPTLPLPHGAQLPFRCTQGRAPGRAFPGANPSPSHPSTERARPSLLTAHQPLLTLPARTAAKVLLPFHWERKKMSMRPQYPAPEPVRPPLPREQAVDSPPGHAAQPLSPSQEHGSSKRPHSPSCSRSLRTESFPTKTTAVLPCPPSPQAPHAPSFPGFSCTTRWELLLSGHQ